MNIFFTGQETQDHDRIPGRYFGKQWLSGLVFWLQCHLVWKCEYVRVEDFFEYVYYIRNEQALEQICTMSIDVSEKLPIKEACEAMEDYLDGCDIDNEWDVFFKGDPAGLRIRVRIERYEDDTREDIKPYIYPFKGFHGYDVVILHVPNGYIEAFPKDTELGK
jgi:hypothetical protein